MLQEIISRVRTDITAIKTKGGASIWKRNEPLTKERIEAHVSGEQLRGVCPIKEGENTTRLALLDLDSHKGETSWDDMLRIADAVTVAGGAMGLHFDMFRSSGGNGIHLIALWDAPQDAYSVREKLGELLRACGYKNGTKGVASGEIEIFPKQNEVPDGGCGNQFILPYSPKGQPIRAVNGLLSDDVLVKKRMREAEHKNFDGEWSFKDINDMLSYISPDCGYDDWLHIGMALHSAGLPCSLWDNWSRCGVKYVSGDCEGRWKGFGKTDQRSIGTLVYLAKQNGWMPHPVKQYTPLPVEPEPETTKEDLKVNGIVGEIADWITNSAIRPQPKLSLAAALGFVAMIKGHKICGATDLRTNLLIMSLSPTGGGKEHPQSCIRKLAHSCGLDKHMLGEPVSGGGFLSGLNEANRVGLLIQDEVGRFFGNISNKNSGGFQKEIVDYIIKTFSCANSVLYGKQYVDTKKNPRIDISQPHFCCIGSTVREKLQSACTSTDVLDGFLNRWLVFDTKTYVERNKVARNVAPPPELIDKIINLHGGGVKYNSYGEPEPQEVRFTPEAWDIFEKYRDDMDVLTKKSGHPVNALYNRSAEHVEKVAMVLCDNEDILCSDVRAAIRIVDDSNKSILEFAGMISDNVYEQDFIRVRDKIKDAKEIARGKLTYQCQFVQGGAKRIQEIVNTLIDDDHVEILENGKKVIYRWIKK